MTDRQGVGTMPLVNPAWAKLPLFDRKGWKTVRFGEVVRQLKEEVDPVAEGVECYVAGEHMTTENVHIRKWGNVGDGYLGPAFIRRFRKGQVLYGSRRTYLKKVAMAEWDGVTANTTFVLEAIEGKLLQELLPWLMLSERFTKHSIQESKGSTNPYINFPDIAKFEFALPPLDQQRRIAEILWAVDETNQHYEKTIDALQQTRSASIEDHFAEIHFRGGRTKLLELADITYGITLGGYRSDLPMEKPYLRVANVGREQLDLNEVKVIRCTEDEAVRFALQCGDVLIVEGLDAESRELEIKATKRAAQDFEQGVTGSGFALYALIAVYYDHYKGLAAAVWSRMQRILTDTDLEPYPELAADLKQKFDSYLGAPADRTRSSMVAFSHRGHAMPKETFDGVYDEVRAKYHTEIDLHCRRMTTDHRRRKEGLIAMNITYINLTGENPRMNINSQDYSINTANAGVIFMSA